MLSFVTEHGTGPAAPVPQPQAEAAPDRGAQRERNFGDPIRSRGRDR